MSDHPDDKTDLISATSVNFYHITRRNILQDIQSHCQFHIF